MHDDFAFEPVPGLPARLPPGEAILWQGRPSVFALARDALGFYWIGGYFAVLAVWQVGSGMAAGSLAEALLGAVPFAVLGALTLGILLLSAWAQARGAIYTITTARVVMRVGAALQVTYNLPFRQIGAASLDLRRDGTGTIALKTLGETRIAWLALWPHARPWRLRHPEPALRAVPDARRVAEILAEAAETRVSEPVVSLSPMAPVAAE
jgi:hypothetical protein